MGPPSVHDAPASHHCQYALAQQPAKPAATSAAAASGPAGGRSAAAALVLLLRRLARGKHVLRGQLVRAGGAVLVHVQHEAVGQQRGEALGATRLGQQLCDTAQTANMAQPAS